MVLVYAGLQETNLYSLIHDPFNESQSLKIWMICCNVQMFLSLCVSTLSDVFLVEKTFATFPTFQTIAFNLQPTASGLKQLRAKSTQTIAIGRILASSSGQMFSQFCLFVKIQCSMCYMFYLVEQLPHSKNANMFYVFNNKFRK